MDDKPNERGGRKTSRRAADGGPWTMGTVSFNLFLEAAALDGSTICMAPERKLPVQSYENRMMRPI